MRTICQTSAASYIRRQAKQLGKQLLGVCHAEDIECVHRARVASRRLRAAFRVFDGCFGGGKLRRWRKHIRRLAQRLGQARDLDVQIEFLCGFVSQSLEPGVCRGLSRLLAELERRRERMQPRVVRAVKSLQRSGVLEKMLSWTKNVLDRSNGAGADGVTPAATGELAPHIHARLEEFLALQESLQEPDDAERLHSFRIAAKRLRYTLEIARSAYPTDLQPFIEAAKTLQTILGEIHDCDVWQTELDGFLAAERKRTLRVYGSDRPMAQVEPGIELLRQDRCRRRQQLVEEATAFWRQLQQQGTWEKLVKLLEQPLLPQTTLPGDTQPSAALNVTSDVSGVPVGPPAVCELADQTALALAKVGTDGDRHLEPQDTFVKNSAASDQCPIDSPHPISRRMRAVAANVGN